MGMDRGGFQVMSSVIINLAGQGHSPISIFKVQPLKMQVFNELIRFRVTLEFQQFLWKRSDHLCSGQVLTGSGVIAQDAGRTVQVPFAGRVDTFGNELDIITLLLFKLAEGPVAGIYEMNQFVIGVYGFNSVQ